MSLEDSTLVRTMKKFADLTREDRIKKVMSLRRKDLVLVLDNLTEELNISAILRSAEGFGVGEVAIIHPYGKKPKLSGNTSKGALKWLNLKFYTSTATCLMELKEKGYQVVATLVDPKAQLIWDSDLAGKIALVVGNEAQGISEEVKKLADKVVYLPMYGLTESLNVSVAAAVALYEIIRQKEKA